MAKNSYKTGSNLVKRGTPPQKKTMKGAGAATKGKTFTRCH
jgi:hypothetical protein